MRASDPRSTGSVRSYLPSSRPGSGPENSSAGGGSVKRVNDLPVSGHVFRVERKRGPQWYVKYRLPDGRQIKKRLGPAWTNRGRPPVGYFTKRTAEAALDEILAAARRGRLAGQVRTGVTFAEACEDFLRWVELDRQRKRSTLDDYRSAVRAHLVPAFGSVALEEVTAGDIDRWRAQLVAEARLSGRSINKLLTILHGIFERARRTYGLPSNPVTDVEKQPRKRRVSIDVFGTAEVLSLVRGADSEQDGAVFLTRGVHRPAYGRVAGTPLARRRLGAPGDPGARQLHPPRTWHSEEPNGPYGADDRCRRPGARAAQRP
jgi:hypothetical protein